MPRRAHLTGAVVLGLALGASLDAQAPDPLGELARYTTLIPDQDDVARTIGLFPLARVKLEDGWREVRLWVSGPGPVLKSRMVRVVEGPDSVFGEVYQWWSDLGPVVDDLLVARPGQKRSPAASLAAEPTGRMRPHMALK